MCCRTARKVIEGKATIQKESIAATLLANQQLNLWGIGSALIGLQVSPYAAKLLDALPPMGHWAVQGLGSKAPAVGHYAAGVCTKGRSMQQQ